MCKYITHLYKTALNNQNIIYIILIQNNIYIYITFDQACSHTEKKKQLSFEKMFEWILLCQFTSMDSTYSFWFAKTWSFSVGCPVAVARILLGAFAALEESYKSLQRYRLSMTILTNISSHHATIWGMHNIIMHYQWIQFGPIAYQCLWYPRTFLTEILQAPFLLVFRQTSCIYTSQTECVRIYMDGTSLSNGIPQLSCTVYSVLVVVSVY